MVSWFWYFGGGMLCMLLYIYGEWKLADCKLAMPSAARLLLYSYVQRNVNVQDNTTQYLESVVRLLLCSCFYRDQSCVSTVPLSGFLHRHTMGCVKAVQLFL
ncbi:conserved hypothetical protein [Trichinella spiralis]|uniref:hypothetical protein n=1 Tax=Trichinella spiralis TaxID=6334 RepID=UPI0001EFB645|nr:conserved hypothetical protein [Trichinella spiralis]